MEKEHLKQCSQEDGTLEELRRANCLDFQGITCLVRKITSVLEGILYLCNIWHSTVEEGSQMGGQQI